MSTTATEVRNKARVALIDADFAQRVLHGEPQGQRISIGPGATNNYEVIGIVSNTRSLGVNNGDYPWYYIPLQGLRFMESKLWIRHRGSASAAEQTLRVAVAREDSDVTVTVHRAEDDVAMAMLPVRIASWAASALGMLALVVAAIALYGVAAFAVNRRLREIGIRMALGAAIAFGHLIRSMLTASVPLIRSHWVRWLRFLLWRHWPLPGYRRAGPHG